MSETCELLFMDFTAEEVISVFEGELCRREKNRKVEKLYIWRTQNDEFLYVNEMSEFHIKNCLGVLREFLEMEEASWCCGERDVW